MKKLFSENPLFSIFVVPIVVDVVGTVLGQPQEFWSGGHKVFNEALPIYPLLQFSPILFIAICLIFWLPFTYWLTKKLKSPLNIYATMCLLIGHGYNSVTWLRIDLFRAGIFAGEDQVSKALSLIPMTLYIFGIGWLATRGFVQYMDKRAKKDRLS